MKSVELIRRPRTEEIIHAIRTINERGWTIKKGSWFNSDQKSMCTLSAYILTKYPRAFRNFQCEETTETGVKLSDFALYHFGEDWVDGFLLMHDLDVVHIQ